MNNKSNNIKISVHEYSNDPNKAFKALNINIKSVPKLSIDSPIDPDKIRIVCISDTHDRAHLISKIPPADILIHAGDFLRYGTINELNKFSDFLAKLKNIKYKIVIAGNHDYFFDSNYSKSVPNKYVDQISKHCFYLQDSEIELFGLKIYGSPWQPAHCQNAFQLERGKDLLEKWDNIPNDIDILVTHGPPLGFGDRIGFRHVGCVELLNTVTQRVKPKLHVFGHIHEDHGIWNDGTTTFINATICNKQYNPVHEPILFDIDLPKDKSKNVLLNKNKIEDSFKELKI